MLRKLLVVLTLLTCSLFYQAHAATSPGATSSTRSSTDATWKRRQALFSHNRQTPLNARLISRQDTTISVIERYTISGAKGDTVPLLFVMPKVPAKTRVPLVVLAHGFLGNVDQMLFFAQICAKNGYACVIPEIVAHGARQQNGQNLFGGDLDFLHDGIVETVGDFRRAIDFAITRPRVDARRIGFVGISLGAILGTMTTALDSRIQVFASVVGGGDWKLIVPAPIRAIAERDARENRGGQLVRKYRNLLEDVDPKNYASRLAPRPFLMLNGRRDNIIPPAAARVLFNAARRPKSQKWYDAGHFLPPLEVANLVQKWLDNNLKNRRNSSRSATSSTRSSAQSSISVAAR